MRSSTWRSIAAGAGILLAAGWCLRPQDPIGDVSAVLEASVRPGMTAAEVVSALDSLDVERSGYRSDERAVFAIWRGFRMELFTESAVQATFQFSESGRLLRWELREVFIGQ